MLKKLLLLIVALFILPTQVKATHYFGSEISYRYIGDSTNTNRHYLIRFTSYADSGTNQMSSTMQIEYTSSCNPGGTLTASLASGYTIYGIPVNSQYDCSSFQFGTLTNKKWVYEVSVILPVNCSDWEFHNSVCCRNTVSNLITGGADSFLVKAKLNSIYKNNSPRIVNEGGRYFCANSPNSVSYSQYAIEADGDSLVYSFGQPEAGPYPGTPIQWNSGYSINSPITTANGINLNPATGLMSFQPTNAEFVALKINIDEYRFDAFTGLWINIGRVTKDLELTIINSCSNSASDWEIETTLLNANCGDSTLILNSSVPVSCASISPDGSDFIVYKSDGSIMPIHSAKGTCSNGYSSTIEINLFFPISKNDNMFIVSRIGSDFNTLVNYCGYDLPANDSVGVNVNDCSNIGLEQDQIISSIYPNPSANFTEIEFKDSSPKSIVLYNPDGQILKKIDIAKKNLKLELDGLSKGLYLLQVKTKGAIEVARILKK